MSIIIFNKERQLKYSYALLDLIARKIETFTECKEKENMINSYIELIEILEYKQLNNELLEESIIIAIEQLDFKTRQYYGRKMFNML